MNREVAFALLIGAGLFLVSRSSAQPAPISAPMIDPPNDDGIEWGDYGSSGSGDPYNPAPEDFAMNPTPVDVDTSDYLTAFLWMIGAAETSPAAMRNGTAFNLFYGWTTFQDLSDHPVLTGEKRGVPLPDEWCRKAGFSPGCVSTAAGFAQINVPTWRQVREAGVWGPRLPDFGPESQWEAARRVLILCGALDYVRRGEFDLALHYASRRWASLKGSQSGQPQKSRDTLFGYYQNMLGLA